MTTVYSTANKIFKDLWIEPAAVLTEMFKTRPLMAWIPTEYNCPGEVWYRVIGTGLSTGISNTFSVAQTNAAFPNPTRFSFSPVDVFGVEQLGRKIMMQSASTKGALFDLTKRKFDSLIEGLAWKFHRQIWRSGTGALGRRSSASTNVITLTSAADVNNFYLNQTVVASAADGGALRTGSSYITAINPGRTTSTITLNDASDITSFGDGDYLYIEGDAQNNGTKVAITGIPGWLPDTVTSTAFHGVDRTVDPRNLAGHRIDAATEGLNARDAIEALLTEIQTVCGTYPDVIFTHPRVHEAARIASSDNIRYTELKGNLELVIKGFEILGVPVVADFGVEAGKAFALCKDAINLRVVNSRMPDIVNETGSDQLLMASEDAYEMRSSTYLQLDMVKPIKCGVAYGIPTA